MRARVAADGSFKGVVHANLTSEHFFDLFDEFSLGSQGAVTLRMESLRLIARYSAADSKSTAGVGTSNVSAEFKAALAENPQGGTFIARTALDGIERVSAYRRLPEYPMILLVGIGTDDFYAPWRTQALVLTLLTSLLALMEVGLSLLFYRRLVIQAQTQTEMTRLAAEREALLQSGLVGMAKVKDRVVLWHNQALSDMFDYGPGELLGRPSRLLYPDDSSYEGVGEGYLQLIEGGQYRTQLQMLRKDGHLIWIDLSGAPLPNGESLWMMVDISAVKEGEIQAMHLAQHDLLTGLANRLHFVQALDYALRDAKRNSRRLAVCYMDLDGFKAINDQYGHEAGDLLLREIAQRMTESVRSNDMVARIGGDEFVVLLNDLDDVSQLDVALNRILGAFNQPVEVGDGANVSISTSIGVALCPEHGVRGDILLKLSDQAMYVAKRDGKNRFHIFGAQT